MTNKEVKDYLTTPRRWVGIRPWTRHSLVLLIAGLAYFGIGISYFYTDPGESRYTALIIARHWMPLEAWGMVFMLVGIATALSSRWPPTADKWGYAVLTALSSGWSGFYLTGVIFENTPTSNYTSAVIWGMIAFLWWAISGLINPDRVAVVIVRGSR